MLKKTCLTAAAVGTAAAAAEGFVCSLLLKNIGALLTAAGETGAAEIFSALGSARRLWSLPVFILTAAAIGASAAAGRKRPAMYILTAFACIFGLVAQLLCIRVNGVPVYSAVGVIIDISAAGML